MKKNLISKFVTLLTLSFLITANIFALNFEAKPGKAISTARLNTNWKTYEICEDSIQVAFPVSPVKKTKAIDSGFGTTPLVIQYTSILNHSFYTVSCSDASVDSEKLSSDEKKFVYEFIAEEFKQKMEQKSQQIEWLTLRETTANGLSTFEQDFNINDRTGAFKILTHGQYVIFALTVGSSVKNKKAFLSSFKGISNKV